MGRLPPTFLLPVAIALTVVGVGAPAASAATDPTLTRYPYLTDSVQDSITVSWATTRGAGAGTVRWGPQGNCALNTTTATHKKAITVNSVPEYQWQAEIPVDPDTRYCYRPQLGSIDLLGSDQSPAFTSQVAAGSSAPFSFAVFGDWGQAYANSANPDQANVLARMSESGARFAVMTGDTAYQSGSQTAYGDLQQKGTDISSVFAPDFWTVPGRSLPVFNVTGNHGFTNGVNQVDNWPEGNATSSSGGKYAMEPYGSYNGSTPTTYPSFWYAFDAGKARFYVLTTAWADQNPKGADPYVADAAAHWTPSSAEYQWLKQDLASHPRSLKFAFWHYPIFADSSGQGSDTYLQGGSGTLQGLLNQNNVNLAFNGHAHGYQRNKPDPAGLVTYVNGNGGADLGKVSGCTDMDLYAIGRGGSHCGAGPAGLGDDHVFGFSKVTVDGQRVTVTPTDELGRTYDVQTYTFPSSETDKTKPSVPADLAAGAPAANRVDLSWSASTDNVGVTGYRIYRDGTMLSTLTGPGTTYTDATVTSDTAYRYQVTALDAAGNESAKQSPGTTVQTPGLPDTQPPTAPGGLRATADTGSQVDLSWTASADNVGVTGYRITRNGVRLPDAPAGATSYGDQEAELGVPATYTVRAFDAAGNLSAASVATVTPGSGTAVVPAAPGRAVPPAAAPPAGQAVAGSSSSSPDGPARPRACARSRRGTRRANHLNGSSKGDKLRGLRGNDVLEGRGGDDCLYGNQGRDRLYGGSGRDRLYGGDGNDVLSGGTNDDTLTGGGGHNVYRAGRGNDRIHARNHHRDTIDCGPGRDRVTADHQDRLRHCERVRRARATAGK